MDLRSHGLVGYLWIQSLEVRSFRIFVDNKSLWIQGRLGYFTVNL